ncbi:hypothetical protein [Acidiphilium sp.]|uniref:hypothetical protein n=1 Tax=Acidiphilium sp. TaxID=527 RepID=UPI00258DCD4E|nr:hypothetical protein [Acidiphilium sp.]
MPDLAVCTLLWDPNGTEYAFSRIYDESWVEKLARGVRRHCTLPFEFIVWTDRERTFSEPVTQMRLSSDKPSYADCIEPYRLGRPMILVGLDTIITGNIDALARQCLESHRLAVPRDPFFPDTVCNGVALVPGGFDWVWRDWQGQNDMDWIRSLKNIDIIDDLFPAQVVSYKGHVKHDGLGDARIVYFHGAEKPHEAPVSQLDWVRREWV